MTDATLLARLRGMARGTDIDASLFEEAADEIERLRRELAKAEERYSDLVDDFPFRAD